MRSELMVVGSRTDLPTGVSSGLRGRLSKFMSASARHAAPAAASSSTSIAPTGSDPLVKPRSVARPPDLKGTLTKWTNIKRGWRPRWFVLENGILSYYRTKDDEPHTCRGLISTSVAVLTPGKDKGRFEIHSRISSSMPKIVVKCSNRDEAARWMQAIKLNIEHYSRTANRSSKPSVSQAPAAFSPSLATGTASEMADLADGDEEVVSLYDMTDGLSLVDSADDEMPGMPHEGTFDLAVINIKSQVEIISRLVQTLNPPTSPNPAATPGGKTASRSSSDRAGAQESMQSALSTLSSLISQQSVMIQDRERYLMRRAQREADARKLWEENMVDVAQQQALLDRQLTRANKVNEKKRRALKQAKGVLADISASGSLVNSPIPGDSSLPVRVRDAAPDRSAIGSAIMPPSPVPDSASSNPAIARLRSRGGGHGSRVSIASLQEVQAVLDEVDSDGDVTSDDEFFDAAEAIPLMNMRADERIANPSWEHAGSLRSPHSGSAASSIALMTDPSKPTDQAVTAPLGEKMDLTSMASMLARKSLEPYLEVRQQLPNGPIDRPIGNLWTLFKSSIGRDPTKNAGVSVDFNEPISMLQRMAEDLEYEACLSVAASEPDSLKRIAYVGAFAMSSYSSTPGRAWKPFNPLLSESFEFAVPGRYRFISEQVSHHPPVSVCYGEAEKWRFYGEVEPQQSFSGRSAEITLKGVLHAELIIPEQWVTKEQRYPMAGPEHGTGMVVEHYSWRKVKTGLSNIIVGPPCVDHYGDLIVTNHRTGESCVLTFKPMGWRGKQSMEIKGAVMAATGDVAWEIAGRWNSQLIARRAGASRSPLDSDATFGHEEQEYMLLWRNGPKDRAPFCFTPFTLNLNHLPAGLDEYLAPTDSRKRSDQRAVEDSQNELAQRLKGANEALQRQTRQLRAEGQLPEHRPRWFTPAVDADSGERAYMPIRAESGEVAYWHERERALGAQWPGVEQIFVEQ